MIYRFIVFNVLLISHLVMGKSSEPTVFSYQGSQFEADRSHNYTIDVLKLALDKTKAEYGDYKLELKGHGLNVARVVKLVETGYYKNFFFKHSITTEISKKVHTIHFPIDRGIIGYRIALIHPSNLNKFCNLTEESAVNNISIVQGIGWTDSDILQANNYRVYPLTNPDHDKVFGLIKKGRVDAYFRGVTEEKDEYFVAAQKKFGLVYEPCISFAYELPRFFITHINNHVNAKRVELGLKRAYKDGSFIKLWEKHHLHNLIANKLVDRKILWLENPLIQGLSQEYKKYNFSVQEYFDK
ncbi:hypothetical protein [Paraglaciecola sp.]|uniref:hypothetical protein n=1 Tax=Paraglaciecola sp. TaxID=1920173 RepID=UPI003EF7E021